MSSNLIYLRDQSDFFSKEQDDLEALGRSGYLRDLECACHCQEGDKGGFSLYERKEPKCHNTPLTEPFRAQTGANPGPKDLHKVCHKPTEQNNDKNNEATCVCHAFLQSRVLRMLLAQEGSFDIYDFFNLSKVTVTRKRI